MKRRMFNLLFLLLATTHCFPRKVQAIDIVFDPANLAQNIIEAIRLLQSNINEAEMIANQIQSLENEFRNLESLSFDIISDFSGQFDSLFTVLGTIEGLMQNLSTLETRFEELYPDFSSLYFPVPSVFMAEDIHSRVETTREMIKGSLKTSAQILDSLPANKEQLAGLMAQSQGAVGILQAAQSGNQIAGDIAGQLINLNAQLASYIQAHTAQLMEENGAALSRKNRMDHVLDRWVMPHTPDPIDENPF